MLDVGFKEYKKKFPGVYQNFEKDIYSILLSNQHLVNKYKRLFLVVPESLKTKDIITGFKKFSKIKTLVTGIKLDFAPETIKKQDAFIIIDDNKLVKIIKIAKEKNWQPGKDIGIISYNETSLKALLVME